MRTVWILMLLNVVGGVIAQRRRGNRESNRVEIQTDVCQNVVRRPSNGRNRNEIEDGEKEEDGNGNEEGLAESRRDERRGESNDDVIADAGNIQYKGRNSRGRKLGKRRMFSDDEEGVIMELDVIEPIPCTLESSRTRSFSRAVVRQIESEGDGSCDKRRIKLNGPQRDRFKRSTRRRARAKRAASKDPKLKWPSTDIPYTMNDTAFGSHELRSIQEAIDEYKSYTCINWVRRTTQISYVNIVQGCGCASYIGKVSRQPQVLSLGTGCAESKTTPIHEMLHTLGVYHQQRRSDRDEHLTINLENADAALKINFAKLRSADADVHGTNYSYYSIMHYGRDAFSNNGLDTIITKEAAFQTIIGTATTFSFEDLQLINRFYECDSSCGSTGSCPDYSYRGKDCVCYCRNLNNHTVPAIPCEHQPACTLVQHECGCTKVSGACDGLQNSECSPETNACECDSTSVPHEGNCEVPANITCDMIGKDCKCSLKQPDGCNHLPNTECNISTDTCKCKANFGKHPATGQCVNINTVACNVLGEDCFCSKKPGACDRIANSHCNQLSRGCDCNEDYYPDLQNHSLCRPAPVCDSVGTPCKCTIQGGDACQKLRNTVCLSSTGACQCGAEFHLSNGTCVPGAVAYISNGDSVSPFLPSMGDRNFTPSSGLDASGKNSFGISSNEMRLKTTGNRASQFATIEAPPLPPGNWCVSFSYKAKYAAIWTEDSHDGESWGFAGVGADWRMEMFFPQEYIFITDTLLRIRFTTEIFPGYDDMEWETLIDPLIIQKCKP